MSSLIVEAVVGRGEKRNKSEMSGASVISSYCFTLDAVKEDSEAPSLLPEDSQGFLRVNTCLKER